MPILASMSKDHTGSNEIPSFIANNEVEVEDRNMCLYIPHFAG